MNVLEALYGTLPTYGSTLGDVTYYANALSALLAVSYSKMTPMSIGGMHTYSSRHAR